METNRQLFDALGMALIDSLWQGALVMSVAFLGLYFMKKNKASARHNFLLLCILALPIMSVYTFSQRFEKEAALVETTSEEAIALPSLDVSFPSTEGLSTPVISEIETLNWLEMIPWLGLFWTLGLSLFLIRSVGSYVYLSRLKSGANDLSSREIIRLFNQLREGFDIKAQVLLRESSKVSSPMVYGYFKPIILFPLGLIQGLSMDEVEVILLHELAHLKRNDFLINIVINGLRAVYFYHPVFWWLQSQLDNEREFAADEMVMEKKTDGLVLVRALSKAQEFSMLSPSLGFAGSSKYQLLKRVNRIMKKQQKPNWTGLLLPCTILLSVFLLSSQSDSKKQETESESVVNQSDTAKVRHSFKLPTEAEIQNAKLEYIDSLGNRHVSFVNAEEDTVDIILFEDLYEPSDLNNDTVSVAQATMELLEDPSPISVTVSMGDGMPIYFYKNGRMIKGDEFKVYEEAYLKLYKYLSKSSTRRLASFMGADDQQAVDDSKSPKIRLRENGLEEVAKLEKQLEIEKALMDEMIIAISKNPKASNQEVITLNEQVSKVGELAELVRMVQLTTTDLQRATLREKQREFEQKAKLIEIEQKIKAASAKIEQINQKQMYKLHLEKLQQMTAQEREALFALEKNFSSESKELGKMVFELTSNPNDADPAAVAKQAQKYAQIEEQLAAMLGGPAAAKSHIDSLKLLDESRYRPMRRQSQINEEKRQQQLIKEQVSVLQAKHDSFRGTSYTEDGKSIDFHLGQEGLEFAQGEYQAMQDNGGRPILEIDGVLMPNTKLSDVKMDSVLSIAVYKEKALEKRYPNGETKGRSGLIAITTVNGLKKELTKKVLLKGEFNFENTLADQNKAIQMLEKRNKLFDNPVVVFNGKFMPKDYILRSKDAYIETINIYKGDALTKFPKRKVKGHDAVIEVITKKEPSPKN